MDLDITHVPTEIEELEHIAEYKKHTPEHYNHVNHMSDIHIGSHIYYENRGGHHGIIVKKEVSKFTLLRYRNKSVIDFEDIVIKGGDFYVKDYKKQVKIQLQVALYKGQTFSPLSVVHRALARSKEQNYGRLRNYAWGFPRWCVTGNGGPTYDDMPVLRDSYEHKVYADDLSCGDHIMFQYLFYSHHALVLSVNDCDIKVIHFAGTSGTSGQKPEIKEDTITLSAGHRMYRVVYRRNAASDAKLVLERAKQMVMAQTQYQMPYNDGENFVTWCKTGIWQGDQFKRVAAEED